MINACAIQLDLKEFLSQKPARLRRIGLARFAGWTIFAAFVLIAVFADFLAPYDYREQVRAEPSAPPSRIDFALGRPTVHGRELVDPLRLTYVDQDSVMHPVAFFVHGQPHRVLGIIETDIHLFGTYGENVPRVNLLGTDILGRDRFSRMMHAIRFSLIVCTAGVVLACLIGIAIGIVSGYSSPLVDTILMGAADAMLALPALILILAARAAFPLELPPARAAFLLLLIFALTGWAEMARLSRGLVM